MPSSSQARSIRRAISPRFATRSLRIITGCAPRRNLPAMPRGASRGRPGGPPGPRPTPWRPPALPRPAPDASAEGPAATRLMSALAAATACGPLARMASTTRRTSSSSASGSTTACTRPISRARSAEKRAPVRNSSRAADGPTFATTNGEMTAGTMPSRTSVNPNDASRAAMTMSHTAARPDPPPRAAPCTQPTSGNGSVSSRLYIRASASASRRFSALVYSAVLAIHERSPPAENTRPAPRSTAARTPRSACRETAHSESSSTIASLKALRTSGRLSVRCSTDPSRRVTRCMKAIATS